MILFGGLGGREGRHGSRHSRDCDELIVWGWAGCLPESISLESY